MKIGIDISETTGEKTGVGFYTTHLVDALAEIDDENRYTLYPVFYDTFPPTYRRARCPENPNFHLFGKHMPTKVLTHMWHKSGIPKEKLFGYQDVVHSTTFSSPELTRGALVVTIYDLSFWTHPECHRSVNTRYCAEKSCLAARRAERLIAISEATKRDIIRFLHFPEERISVTPLAAHPRFQPVSDLRKIHEILMKYSITSDYIFFLGSLEPRKNLTSLIQAYAGLPERYRQTVQLIIAGARGWKNSQVFRLIEKLGLMEKVRVLGYVEDEDLPVLYSGASVFVYPSLYEGFGLPALEAMACGTPVISSDTSSLPEVIGDAGIMVPPTDVQRLTEAILGVIGQKQLRLDMKRKSLQQAGKFSWNKTAELTLEVYKEAVAEKSIHSQV